MLLNDSLGVERNSVSFNFRFCTMLYSIITSLTKARAIRILFNSIKIFLQMKQVYITQIAAHIIETLLHLNKNNMRK